MRAAKVQASLRMRAVDFTDLSALIWGRDNQLGTAKFEDLRGNHLVFNQKHLAFSHLGHVMRKPVYAICEKQRRRSVCASAQFEQPLFLSLS